VVVLLLFLDLGQAKAGVAKSDKDKTARMMILILKIS
jgi:hypothetical protein